MVQHSSDRTPLHAAVAAFLVAVLVLALWLATAEPTPAPASVPEVAESISPPGSHSGIAADEHPLRAAIRSSDDPSTPQSTEPAVRTLPLTFVDPTDTPIPQLPFHALQLGEQLSPHLQLLPPIARQAFNDCMAPSVVDLGEPLVTDRAGKATLPFSGQPVAVAAWHDDLAGLHVLSPAEADQEVTITLRPAQVAEVRVVAATPDIDLPIAIDWLRGDDLLASHSLGITRAGSLTFPWLGVLRATIPEQEPDRARFRIDLPGAASASEPYPAAQRHFVVQLQAKGLHAARTFTIVDAAGAPRPTFRGRCDLRDAAGHLWTCPIFEGRCRLQTAAGSALEYLLRDSKGRIVGQDPLPAPAEPDVLATNRQAVITARLEKPDGTPLEEGTDVTIQPDGGAAATTQTGPSGHLRHSLLASEGTALRFDVATPATPLIARSTLPAAHAGLHDLGTLRLQAPEASLHATVTDPTGTPLADAELTARQHNRDLATRRAADGSFLVFAADLEQPLFLRATAPDHTTTRAEVVSQPRLTLVVEPAIRHEIVLDLPDDIAPQTLTALLVTDHGEHAPDAITTENGTWRGSWAHAPRHAPRLRILARCPTRIVQESPLELTGESTRLTPDLRGWRQAEVAITHYRHWGVYVAPLDGTATLHCTDLLLPRICAPALILGGSRSKQHGQRGRLPRGMRAQRVMPIRLRREAALR